MIPDRARAWAGGVAAATALLGLLPAVASDYLLDVEAAMTLCMVAIGLNVVTGFAGQLSLGPSAVFAVGAYTAAVLANRYPQVVDLPLMVVAAIAAASLLGLAAGIPALRVGGFYLGMVTLYVALLIPSIVGALEVTGRHNGISLVGNPGFSQDLSGIPLYETVGVVLFLLVGLSALLLHSRVGRRFAALRTSEVLAESLGISGYRTKLLAFLLSAIPAGIAGALYVYSQQLVSPGSINPLLSIDLLAACVIGGFGTVWGPVVGGAIVLGSPIVLTSSSIFQAWKDTVYAVLLIVTVLLAPEGLVGVRPAQVWRRWRRRSAPLPPGAAPVAASAARPKSTSSGASPRRPGAFLELRDIGKRFGGVQALDGVDLVVRGGTVHALIGPNGSGKTTMLNLASGFYRPDRGSILLDGRPLGPSADAIARAGVARTFQTPKLVERATLLDNVLVAAERHGRCRDLEAVLRLPRGRVDDRVARTLARTCLDRVGLGDLTGLHVAKASHGTRRLVELARAMALEPRVVLLDEPAAGLGPEELTLLSGLLRDLAAAGVAVLLVEHNMPFVLGLADEVTVLHRGTRLAAGSPGAVRADPEVSRVYLGAA